MILSQCHQRNGQVKACIKFVKCMIKKCKQTNNNVNFTLLQIGSTPIGPGIPSLAMLLFIRPIRVLLPQIGRDSINVNKDHEYYEALKSRQDTYIKNNNTHKDSTFPAESTVAVQKEDGGPCTCKVVIEGNIDNHQG